jgi:hypothetical protein
MPQIHGSLTNEEFVLAFEQAKKENVDLKTWVSTAVLEKLHKGGKKA